MLARLLFIWMFLLSAQVLASAEGMYIHTDGLGSPVAKSDKNGNYIAGSRTRYEPYGATAAGATPTIGFTGHVNDADTGLIYMQQRYYDPYAGRFLSTDPVLTDANTGSSFNRYIYASSNPFKYIDPDGRDIVVVVNNNTSIIGTHVGIIVRGAGSNLIYDPGGSFMQNAGKGSGDTIGGKIKDYIAFQKTDGPDVQTYTVKTSEEDDLKITENIEQGGCDPGFCSICAGAVLRGVGPFKNLGSTRTPAGMGREMKKIQEPDQSIPQDKPPAKPKPKPAEKPKPVEKPKNEK